MLQGHACAQLIKEDLNQQENKEKNNLQAYLGSHLATHQQDVYIFGGIG